MAPKRRKPFFIRGTYFDYPSLFFILFLVFFGVMMVYSSSSFVSYRLFNNNTHYLFRQIFFGMLGIMVMFGVSKIRYQVLRRFSYIGVLGIDFIYSNNELFFIEINPRFQGSTRYLDRILQENNFKSIYEYNYNAFYNIEIKQIKKYFYE